jgi:poly(3-hydroxybutyrate) depolymerase
MEPLMISGFVRRTSLMCALTATALAAQSPANTFDYAAPAGLNYEKAEFRLWLPPGIDRARATLVLVPGSNGDGRAMVEDTAWRAFAQRNHLAIVACRFTDKPHDQGFIEEYVAVASGSGAALLSALTAFARDAHHPELADSKLLFWGMSAGGQFNYEFAAWRPERVIAFVVNKGGIYYTALAPRAARAVPALLFVGGKDLEFRTNTIVGLFAVNRRGGALWALTEEPNAAHVVGQSRDLSIIFFDDVLPLRLGAAGEPLKAIVEGDGFLGDLRTHSIARIEDGRIPTYPTAWLPTARVAEAWRAVVADTSLSRSGPLLSSR